MMKLNKTFN